MTIQEILVSIVIVPLKLMEVHTLLINSIVAYRYNLRNIGTM